MKLRISGIMGFGLSVCLSLGQLAAHPDIERQIDDVSARIEAEPANPDLYLKRGELYRIHRDWSKAEEDYRRARRIAPQLRTIDFYVGRMRLEQGKPRAARKHLDRFLQHEPDHVKGRVVRGRALRELGRPLEAASDFTRAIAARTAVGGKPDPSYYIERARALADAGGTHVAEAVRGLNEGLELLGRPITLELQAIELELELGRLDSALERVEGIASRSQRKESWHVRRGEILELAGRLDEARRAYGEALAALDALPASRRGNRAMRRLESEARESLKRLDETNRDATE